MKRVLIMVVLVVMSYVLQSTALHNIALAKTIPNLLLIIVVSHGYMRGSTRAMFLGLFTGLLVDCQYGDIIGFHAFLYMLIGYLTGLGHKIYYQEDFTMPILLVAISDFVYNLLFYFFSFLLRNRTDFFFYLKRIIIPELIYTVLVSILFYKLLHMIYLRLENSEKKEA